MKNPTSFLTKKVLGIDTKERYSRYPDNLEDRAKEALLPARPYFEDEPSVSGWINNLKPTKDGSLQYVRSLFPSLGWMPRYNLRWLMGDVVAGITVGFVVIPQAMAYAILAQLSPEYGLYTSFTGAILYWLFGTSKDIVIGTTAVGSLLIGSVVGKVQDAVENGDLEGPFTNDEIARTLSLVAGVILLFFGLFRLGWIIDFIPYPPISAFVTAASITIMSTQAPVLLGIKGINTREEPYKVIIATLKNLPDTQLDAAIGVSCLAMLFMIREFCSFMEKRQPQRKRLWSTISSLRQTFAMVLYTLIAYLVHLNLSKSELDDGGNKFRLVGTISKGFNRAAVPKLDGDLITHILPELPALIIILIVEHIAIAKSFGRIFDYTIAPSQEILAQGAANVFSPFVGGYVCTGSFGASAVLSKAGVRTPLAGLFSAFILVLALYALTGVFYFIPNAALAGLIIHAVSNLLTPPRSLYKYWLLSPLEFCIWVIGVILAILDSLETSIYVTTGLSAAVLLFRIARTRGRFLGKVSLHQVPSDDDVDDDNDSEDAQDSQDAQDAQDQSFPPTHDAFIPFDHADGSNPAIPVESPYPGVFVYRFDQTLSYASTSHHVEQISNYILSRTRRVTPEQFVRESDRLWNDATASQPTGLHLPILRAVVLDCSAVGPALDITVVQALVDLRTILDRHASPEPVEWHFANLSCRWARRALAVAGFGFPAGDNPLSDMHWSPIYPVAATSPRGRVHDVEEGINPNSAAAAPVGTGSGHPCDYDDEASSPTTEPKNLTTAVDDQAEGCYAPLHGVNRPFFHLDLVLAVQAAVRDAVRADDRYEEERRDVIARSEYAASLVAGRPASPVGSPVTPADSRGVA